MRQVSELLSLLTEHLIHDCCFLHVFSETHLRCDKKVESSGEKKDISVQECAVVLVLMHMGVPVATTVLSAHVFSLTGRDSVKRLLCNQWGADIMCSLGCLWARL